MVFFIFGANNVSIRDEDGRGGGAGLLAGILNVGEDGEVQVSAAGLLGVGTTDNVSAWGCVSSYSVFAIAIGGREKVP